MWAVFAFSAALQAYSSISEGYAKAEALNQQANMLDMQNKEYQRKVKFNIDNMNLDLQSTKGDIATKSAGAGVDIGSGVSLQAMRSAMLVTSRNIAETEREAAYSQMISGMESSNMRSSAEDAKTAGLLGGVSSAVSSYGNYKTAAGTRNSLYSGR